MLPASHVANHAASLTCIILMIFFVCIDGIRDLEVW